MKWKDQIGKWIKLYCRTKRTAPSDDDCHDKNTVDHGFVNEEVVLSLPVDITTTTTTTTITQSNGQLPANILNIFVKHVQESA